MELTTLVEQLQGEQMNDNVLDSVMSLKKNVQQNMFDIDFFLKEQARSDDDFDKLNSEGTILHSRNNIAENEHGKDMNNDVILNDILDKLQVNLVIASQKLLKDKSMTRDEYRMLVNKHVEQFKKELHWYEDRKNHYFEIIIDDKVEDNKKLQMQNDKLHERWNSLVESARERRNR